MRKLLNISVIVLALLALVAVAAYACGEKKTCAEKASSDTKTSSVSKATACDGQRPGGTASAATKATFATKTIAVKGMTCTTCEDSISAALTKVKGVQEVVQVCHKSGTATVKVAPETDLDAALTKAITAHGYQAEIIPAVAKTVDAAAVNSKTKGSVCPFSGGPGCGAVEKASSDKGCAEKTSSDKDKTEKKTDESH